MGYIKEWIKNGKIKKFKKQLSRVETVIEKKETVILEKEKELQGLYEEVETKKNEVGLIKNKLENLGYIFEEIPVIEDDLVEDTSAVVVKKESAPVMANTKSDIKIRVGKSVLSLNKISKEDFFELIDKKYNLMVSAYDKVLKVLYPQIYIGNAEAIQRENYINEITKVYNSITSKYGNIYMDKAIDFLQSKIDVGVGYELELQKKDENEVRKYSNMEYKSLSAFVKNPVVIPTNAMKINVAIRSDINKLNKMTKMAGLNIYLFESAKYSKEEAKEKFYENNKYTTKYADIPFAEIAEDDYYYYNQTQCEVIKDKVLAKNTISKAMYIDDLSTGFFDFVDPDLMK